MVALIWHRTPGVWLVDIDKDQVSQVISNLVINARHAMAHGGSLCIKVEDVELPDDNVVLLPGGRYVKIIVRDEGMGISPKHIDKIFEPYFTTKQAGSGLGLAICHSIIRKHDGNITVSSELGVGTTFLRKALS